MLPEDAYICAAREASSLLQLSITSVEVGELHATVSGTVARVFHGADRLLGQSLVLEVPVITEHTAAPPSGIGRTPAKRIRPGRVLEAYVNETDSGPEIPLGMCAVLERPTDEPQLETLFAASSERPRRSQMRLSQLAY